MARAKELTPGQHTLLLSAHHTYYFDDRRGKRHYTRTLGGLLLHDPRSQVTAELHRVEKIDERGVWGNLITSGSEDPAWKPDTTRRHITPNLNFPYFYVPGMEDPLMRLELKRAGLEVIWLEEGEESYVSVQRRVPEGTKPAPILEFQGKLPK